MAKKEESDQRMTSNDTSIKGKTVSKKDNGLTQSNHVSYNSRKPTREKKFLPASYCPALNR